MTRKNAVQAQEGRHVWSIEWRLLAATVAALATGGIGWLSGAPWFAGVFWSLGTVAALIPALWWVAANLRKGRLGVDILAVLSLAGTVIAGVLTGRSPWSTRCAATPPDRCGEAIVREAVARSPELTVPQAVAEEAGSGVTAVVERRRVSGGCWT